MAEKADSPGWNAITEALKRLYGDREPKHWGTLLPYSLGGPDPIDGLSAYKVLDPTPHWHFITFGFSELWEKKSSNKDLSGFGFELTFRLACSVSDEEPPKFVWNFLQNLGRYVFQTGNAFAVGHHMPLNGPIEMGSDTIIWAILFALDPQLEATNRLNGRLEFLQIVGIAMEELDAILGWDSQRFAGLVRRDNPLLITDLHRKSLLSNPSFAHAVREGIQRDGSSCAALNIEPLRVHKGGWLRGKTRIVIGDHSVRSIRYAMFGRLGHKRDLALNGSECSVCLLPNDTPACRWEGRTVTVGLPKESALALAKSLRASPGEYVIPGLDSVVFVVEHVEIESGG